jgi:hypothetical protein
MSSFHAYHTPLFDASQGRPSGTVFPGIPTVFTKGLSEFVGVGTLSQAVVSNWTAQPVGSRGP